MNSNHPQDVKNMRNIWKCFQNASYYVDFRVKFFKPLMKSRQTHSPRLTNVTAQTTHRKLLLGPSWPHLLLSRNWWY